MTPKQDLNQEFPLYEDHKYHTCNKLSDHKVHKIRRTKYFIHNKKFYWKTYLYFLLPHILTYKTLSGT